MNKYDIGDFNGRRHKVKADSIQVGDYSEVLLHIDHKDNKERECIAIFHRPAYVKKIEDKGAISDE